MPPSVVVVIREDPQKSHRAVEALRIALGLSTGENPLSVILLGQAPLMISEEPEDVMDGEIMEKYLPSFKHLKIPFLVPIGTRALFNLDPEFDVKELSEEAIRSAISGSSRILVF
jgi:sulfur relay (sulfurtransferase) DsrF/TusC family protein